MFAATGSASMTGGFCFVSQGSSKRVQLHRQLLNQFASVIQGGGVALFGFPTADRRAR